VTPQTFRVWQICYGTRQLHTRRLDDSTMLIAVLAFVLVDIVINAAWAGTAGMGMREVVVDPIRPAHNYRQCDYSSSLPAVYTHLAVKCGLLLLGVALTWSVRHTPSRFNESSYIGVAIYNVSIVICFTVPLVASNVGGRRATYLVRSFATLFTAVSTVAILYVPKLAAVYSLRAVKRAAALAVAAGPAGATGAHSIVQLYNPHATATDKDNTSKALDANTKRAGTTGEHNPTGGGSTLDPAVVGPGSAMWPGSSGFGGGGGGGGGGTTGVGVVVAEGNESQGELDEDEVAYARQRRERDARDYSDLAAMGASQWADEIGKNAGSAALASSVDARSTRQLQQVELQSASILPNIVPSAPAAPDAVPSPAAHPVEQFVQSPSAAATAIPGCLSPSTDAH
jgi:hypothetical protein